MEGLTMRKKEAVARAQRQVTRDDVSVWDHDFSCGVRINNLRSFP